MKRDAKYLEDGPNKMVRGVLEIIREEYPTRSQLGLFKQEQSNAKPKK